MNIIGISFLLCLAVSLSFDCTAAGYQEYLKTEKYSFKKDASQEIQKSSEEAFIKNCQVLKIREKLGYVADVTGLLDWSDDELESLSDLVVKFNGNVPFNAAITPKKQSFDLSRTPRTFDDLKSYSQKNPILSTSWATAAIEVAEAALDNKVQFDARQLLDCLPIYFEMENDVNGVNPKDLITYLAEVGLVKYGEYMDCSSLENQARYTFEAELPELPNAGGLMNLMEKGEPVFVMLALELRKLRYVKDMSSKDPITCGYIQPTVYGIASGYDSTVDTPYWEVITHIIPNEEITVRIPLTNNATNANYGGIAAYAFTLKSLSNRIDYEDEHFAFATSSFNIKPTYRNFASCSYTSTPVLPDSISFTPETCEFSGYVETVGDYDITVSDSMNNELTLKDSFKLKVIEFPALTYYAIDMYKNVAITDIYPTNEYYGNFEVSPDLPLPSGLSIDGTTGAISGTPTEVTEMKTYTITAKRLNSVDESPVTATISFAVYECSAGNDKALVTLVLRADYSNDDISAYNWKLYEGKEETLLDSHEQLDVKTGFNYYHMCLSKKIHTLVIQSKGPYGAIRHDSGFYLSIDQLEFQFDAGTVHTQVFEKAKETVVFSSYLPFQMGYNNWKILKSEPTEDWTNTGFDDSEWSAVNSNNMGNSESVTTYIRKSFTIPSIDNYHVLNIRMKYKGGVVAYFNGNKVARFNLGNEFGPDSYATEVIETTYSKFHVILSLNSAVFDDDESENKNNIIAFEIHAAEGMITDAIVFDASAVFGVNDCSVVVDSILNPEVSGHGANSNRCYDQLPTSSYGVITEPFTPHIFFDFSSYSWCSIAPKNNEHYLKWSVGNLEGTVFNRFAFNPDNSQELSDISISAGHVDNSEITLYSNPYYKCTAYESNEWEVTSSNYRHFKWAHTPVNTQNPSASDPGQVVITFITFKYCIPSTNV